MNSRARRNASLVATLLLVGVAAEPLGAQGVPVSFDVSLGGTGTAQRAAVSAWWRALQPGARWHLGLGVRVSAYAGDPASYTNYGRVTTGLPPSTSIDPAVYGLTGAVFGELRLSGAVGVGANLDVVGIAAGPTRAMGSLRSEPQTFSLFRYGSADRGALNSEFFAALRVAPRVWVRAGLSHFVTNYVVTDTAGVGTPSSRYQRFETTPFVAVSLRR